MASQPRGAGAYDAAGVRVAEADMALAGLTDRLRRTWPGGRGNVVLDFGHYANVIDLGGGLGLAICTDGVGSKVLIAELVGDYRTIGIDCVAMNVNDLICVGAAPVTFVDYVAVERVAPAMLLEIAEGLAVGAERAGVSISGGEIAELPDMIRGARPGGGFDLAGTAVGTVQLDRILTGAGAIPGDAVVGIESNGIHSNGLTLARKVFLSDRGHGIDAILPELGQSLGLELLRPTHIYVREALDMLDRALDLRALLHITGDGFFNLTRVAAPVGFLLDALPPPPPIFRSLAERGGIPAGDMHTVYNMGVGLCAVVGESGVDAVIDAAAREGKAAWRIGTVTDEPGTVRITANPLTGDDLVGRDKRFAPV
ncbi:MAG: phosphoribosylformylglycinamidine cyclo-ligase [Proteobacteria bacterium]|nr:phosphoribosylformylglycinamidine cyclo-ligase [Pseudomonadota bacterium]